MEICSYDPHKIANIPVNEASKICECRIFAGYHTHPAPVKPAGLPSRHPEGWMDLNLKTYNENVFLSLWFSIHDWQVGKQQGWEWQFMADHQGNIKSIQTQKILAVHIAFPGIIDPKLTKTVGSWK
jgi:hypothetical protein